MGSRRQEAAWPVCALSDTTNPQRMGAALSYARRYALFAMVGIAGEDDLDAPDLLMAPSPAGRTAKPPRGALHKPLLTAEPSAALRDQLIAEIAGLKTADELAVWAHRRLAAKNTLTAEDARLVEAAYAELLHTVDQPVGSKAVSTQAAPQDPAAREELQEDDPGLADQISNTSAQGLGSLNGTANDDLVGPLQKSVRRRNKAHLRFVAAQPCLICRRQPCGAHHLKFGQPRSLGSKVSDEFTVPLCREHHQQLHRHGNEVAWWANQQIVPIEIARELWQATLCSP